MSEHLPAQSTAAGAIQLRGPSSQRLELQGVGEKIYAWEPVDRTQCEVEIRARLTSCNGVLGCRPILSMRVEISHGKTVWREPPEPFNIVAGTPIVQYNVPARGGVWRLNVREFRIAFRNGGVAAGPAWTVGEVDVSIQPASCVEPPRFPRAHHAFPVAPTRVQPFPMEATEWRACDERGLPLAIGAVAILFAGSVGALFGITDGAAFADWNPIPHDAVGWVGSANHYAAFR